MSPSPKNKEPIYIDALAKLVDREIGTIRRWESDNRLPKHLLPKRGSRKRRYWTHAQVHGPRGIIAWMKKNDMRPGNLLTDPSQESEHVAHLRKPKYLNGHHIRSARVWAGDGSINEKTGRPKGKSREYIIRKLFPRTKYSRPENLEAALVRVFEQNGWYFPPAKPKKQVRLSKAKLKEIEKLERRVEALGG